MADRLFELAEEKSPSDSVVLHQRALFEMNHQAPNLAMAEDYLKNALDAEGSDRIVKHSLSELSIKRASSTRNPLLKKQFLNQAEDMCRQLLAYGGSSYERHTIVKIHIQRLRIEVELGELSDDDLSEMLQNIEQELSRHLAAVPGDEYLLSAESQLAEFLAETKRAVTSLKKAFSKNPRSTYIALTLARSLIAGENSEEAEKTLRDAIEANPTEKRLHFLLGKVLLDGGKSDNQELLYHFQRGYTLGDGNLEAHLLYARQKFLVEGGRAAKQAFVELKKVARVGHYERIKQVYPLRDRKRGSVVDHQANYAMLEINGTGNWVYAHESKFLDSDWERLTYGARVSFSVGFSIMGVSGFDVEIE